MILAAAASAPAHADPCKAIPDKGPTPSYLFPGSTFAGPIAYVGDGDSLCVDISPAHNSTGEDWVEVRLADFYAPELHAKGGPHAKSVLERIAMGKFAYCTAGRRSYDRVVAKCRLDGVSIGDLMRGAGIKEGGRGR
jgi:micrococcal nuclease